MKKFHFVFIACFLLIASCKKGSDTCNIPTAQFSLADKQVLVQVVSDGDPQNGYDVEYGTAGFTQGSGTTSSGTATSFSFTVTAYGSYDVYIRKKCTGGNSAWSSKYTVNVDGTTSSCQQPYSLRFQTAGYDPYEFDWYGSGNFYDIEYGQTGFTIGNGTRLRTNSTNTRDQILHQGNTYDFYVRSNCGGNTFSSWAGPQSVYAAIDNNISVPCTAPTNLYAYKIDWQEINFTAAGHGNTGYEISFSTSGSTNTGNIISVSYCNGTVGNPSGFNGTYYFWIRGKCDNGSFTQWVVSQVQ